MNYFFPSFLTLQDLPATAADLPFSVNNGENAIRLLLRSYQLPQGAKVALPFFVCDSLKRSVIAEGLSPVYLDLKPDASFWGDYDNLAGVQAVILVHLYGFMHPDTDAIMAFCKEKNLPLIHDAAQSFGIDEKYFTYSSGIVYSFGAGKSTTAGGGAIIKGMDKKFYSSHISAGSFFLQNIHAKLFFKSRIYGYQFLLKDKIMQSVFSRLKEKNSIRKMSPFQLKAATAAISLLDSKKEKRAANYTLLKNVIGSHPGFELADHRENGLFFKIVFSVKSDPVKFKKYLKEQSVPFFCLSDSLMIDRDYLNTHPDFADRASRIIELSTEAGIPQEEIKRVGKKLKEYAG